MPIDLSNVANTTSATAKTPKDFFGRELTGRGKKTGELKAANNPSEIIEPSGTSPILINGEKDYLHLGKKQGDSDTYHWPVNPIPAEIWEEDIKHIETPNPYQAGHIAHISAVSKKGKTPIKGDFYVTMEPHSLHLEITRDPKDSKKRLHVLTPCYQVFFWWIPAGASDVAEGASKIGADVAGYDILNMSLHKNAGDTTPVVNWIMTATPKSTIDNVIKDLHEVLDHEKQSAGTYFSTYEKLNYKSTKDEYLRWMDNYSLYDHMVDRVSQWTEHLDDVVRLVCEHFIEANIKQKSLNTRRKMLHRIGTMLEDFEAYDVPLDQYSKIYAALKETLNVADNTDFPNAVIWLSKRNLRLMLSDNLERLGDIKDQLEPIPSSQTVKLNPKLSKQQQMAVSTHSSLALVQSGAGTGKSTVVVGRVEYLTDAGVAPEDILVISFTRAAARNICERKPGVKSMTIAKMVHEIYEANFPNHKLSSIPTLNNCLARKLGRNDTFAIEFARRLRDVHTNKSNNALTRLSNYVEAHYDEVIDALDTVGQTTLELEMIVAYQHIDELIEPESVSAKHLIIDEVQDNSILEFIYTIRHIAKHHESLFVVGDSSQTLYEWRGASPKALNIIESSPLFRTYKLDINFRSQDEVLRLANTVLSEIETNTNGMQLHSNDMRMQNPVTETTFKNAVHVETTQVPNSQAIMQVLPEVLKDKVKPWIDDKIAKGEKVCLLAYARRHAYKMADEIKKLYPGEEIVSLVPEKSHDMNVFSAYVTRYWDETKYMSKDLLIPLIARQISNRLQFLKRDIDGLRPTIDRLLAQWQKEVVPSYTLWKSRYDQDLMSEEELLDNVATSLIDVEIANNAIAQSVLSQRNAQQKEQAEASDAHIYYSTIHSAKGLEFDNTCILYNGCGASPTEDKKRIYYVALTRAMNSEFVIAFDDRDNNRFSENYEKAIDKINQEKKAQIFAGINPIVQTSVASQPAPQPDTNAKASDTTTDDAEPHAKGLGGLLAANAV